MNSSSRTCALFFLSMAAGAAHAQGVPDWNQCPTAHAPSAREAFAWTFDAARSRVVLFSGSPSPADTWTFDGTDWALQALPFSPSARFGAAMAFDPVRNRVVFFGGRTSSTDVRNDTWEWDGTTWIPRFPAVAPPARAWHSMYFDTVRQRVVRYGGWGGAGESYQQVFDLWEWDGNDWLQVAATAQPSNLIASQVVWDAARQRAVLVALDPSLGTVQVWEWNGTTWLHPTPATVPPPRDRIAIAYDPDRAAVVLHGGAMHLSQQNHSDTWAWDGTNWTQLAPVHAPTPALSEHQLVYLPTRKSIMLFGGRGPGSAIELNDKTWLFNTLPFAPRVESFGIACTGAAGVPLFVPQSLPWLGESMTGALMGVPAGEPWFLVLGTSTASYWHLILPAELSSFEMPGCWLYASVDAASILSTSQAGWSVPIPNALALRGLSVHAQGIVHDFLVNPRGFVTTQALTFRIGSTL